MKEQRDFIPDNWKERIEMKKKQLLQLEKLMATDEMIQIAKEDIPIERQVGMSVLYDYQNYGMHIMAEVEDKILKVALFLTDHMVLGAKEPVYTLFIDKAKDDFIAYDHVCKKWTSATLEHIKLPYAIIHSEKYCDDGSEKCIQVYLKSETEAFDAILEYQKNLRRQKVLEKHKRITDQWDLVMKKVPKLPKDWEHWIQKTGFTQHFIFYEYNRKGVTQGYCTWCEKDVPVKKPRHNKTGICSCCHNKNYNGPMI